MIIKYIEKGKPFDFKRIDKKREIKCISIWEVGDLTYAKINQFEIKSIATEDIIEIIE